MPPKKDPKPKKDKSKVIEDKTFGLKNKNKSAKVAQYIKQVEQNINQAGDKKAKEDEKQKILQAQRKLDDERKKEELQKLFKPVDQQKVSFGVDPKTVLCQLHKEGMCTKGPKCKFSHDLNIERKAEKIDIYTDVREQEVDDLTLLENLVLSKHGKSKNKSSIVCKFFIEAIEKNKYGWFWECPNGNKECIYQHALPQGYKLKSKVIKAEGNDVITLEEFLETERHKLGKNLTPITLESFNKWKAERKIKKDNAILESKNLKDNAFKSGKFAQLSGRELFDYNPDYAIDNVDEDGDDVFDYKMYRRESDD